LERRALSAGRTHGHKSGEVRRRRWPSGDKLSLGRAAAAMNKTKRNKRSHAGDAVKPIDGERLVEDQEKPTAAEAREVIDSNFMDVFISERPP
jgi:hypothetical protein